MNKLLLDFLRRWWWMLALCVLFAGVLGGGGFPFVFAPPALICLILDGQRGVFRATRVLPVPSRSQALAWWFIAVPLVPLLSIPTLGLGTYYYHVMHPPIQIAPPMVIGAAVAHMVQAGPFYGFGISPWFATAVQCWVALGYGGLLFALVAWMPARPAESTAETVSQMCFGLIWGISIPSLMFILPNLPKVPANIAPWHWLVFAASPICVIVSFLLAPEVMQRRTVAITGIKPRVTSTSMAREPGLTGATLLLVNFLLRFTAVLAAMIIGQLVVTAWMSGKSISTPNPVVGIQFITIAIVFGGIAGELVGLRALRVLPLSTVRLAWLLAACPLTASVGAAVFTALFLKLGNPALPLEFNFGAQALAFGGCGVLALATTLHIASGVRLLILMILGVVPAVLMAVLASHALGFAIGGAIAGTLGFGLLLRGLRKSSAFYQPRRIFGAGPVMAGR